MDSPRMRALLAATAVFVVVASGQVVAFSKKGDSPQDKTGNTGASTSSSAKYVGSDTCKSCHEDQFKQISDTPHSNSVLKINGAEAHSCEACHGPGSEHVDGGGDKSKIFTFRGKTSDEVSRRCLQCHQFSQEHGNFQRSYHAKANVTCTTCHSPHLAKVKRALLVESSPNLCYSCHSEVKADFAKPFRHRVNEGLITCSDCHNVHGAFMGRQLRQAYGQNQVCFKCHTDKQGPFVFEHIPVKTETCAACHQVHGSVNQRLLRVSQVNILCLQCHTTVFGRINSNRVQQPSGPAHNQNQKYVACTLCHQMIHGSNGNAEFMK